MRKLIIIACLIMLLVLGVASASNLDLNVSTDQDLDADINLYSGKNMTVDVNVNSEGEVILNENYNNYQYYEKLEQVTRRTTNTGGILNTMTDIFKMYFGESRSKYVDEDEAETLAYLNKFRESILQEVHRTQIQPLKLEVLAQRKINEKLTRELRAIHEENGWEQDEHGLECYGYIRVMLEEEVNIKSVTCKEGNETQTWHKSVDTAVMIRPVYNEEEIVENVSTNTTDLNITGTNVTIDINESNVEEYPSGNETKDFDFEYEGENINVTLATNTTGNQTVQVMVNDTTIVNQTWS